MFDELTLGGKDIAPPGYPGKLIELPNGSKCGLRPVSSSADKSPSIDINIPGIPVKKIHFEPYGNNYYDSTRQHFRGTAN